MIKRVPSISSCNRLFENILINGFLVKLTHSSTSDNIKYLWNYFNNFKCCDNNYYY